jgi:hypothetical protein
MDMDTDNFHTFTALISKLSEGRYIFDSAKDSGAPSELVLIVLKYKFKKGFMRCSALTNICIKV